MEIGWSYASVWGEWVNKSFVGAIESNDGILNGDSNVADFDDDDDDVVVDGP